MKTPKIFYWDSSVFIAFLSDEQEEDRAQHVEQLLNEAEAGDMFIVTSSFTLVEVIKLKGKPAISPESAKRVTDFFEKDYFKFVDASRKITSAARNLIWTLPGLFPKDAVHLASAIEFAGVESLHGIHSYDRDFLSLNGKLPIKCPITKPVPEQPYLLNVPGVKKSKKQKRTRRLEF